MAADEINRERIAGMSPRQRALLALRLGRRDRRWVELAARSER
jgi:hypothetical protein